MATTADLKNGMYIMYNGKPCVVVYFQHVKPGKGPAFVKTKLRNLENGRILENTFTAGVKLDTISVERRPYQYLYDDGEAFNFMHEETYEQITLPHDAGFAVEHDVHSVLEVSCCCHKNIKVNRSFAKSSAKLTIYAFFSKFC